MLFIDTWGWVALHNKREMRHEEVKSYYQQHRLSVRAFYTTDYVLDETLTLIFRRLPLQLAKISMESMNNAIAQGYLHVEWITPLRFEEANKMRLKFDDKSRISFTDLASMTVMKELGLRDIVTADDHFEHVGLGFQRKP